MITMQHFLIKCNTDCFSHHIFILITNCTIDFKYVDWEKSG